MPVFDCVFLMNELLLAANEFQFCRQEHWSSEEQSTT